MPTQALPVDLPLNWDLALPLGPAVLVALLLVVAVGLVLTISASLAVESEAPHPVSAARNSHHVAGATGQATAKKTHALAA